jgi:hypothetical protein
VYEKKEVECKDNIKVERQGNVLHIDLLCRSKSCSKIKRVKIIEVGQCEDCEAGGFDYVDNSVTYGF